MAEENTKNTQEKKQKIILDCDPGIDDAIALMIACNNPMIDLLGITTVSGNMPLDIVTQNAIDITDWLGADVPVYKGCNHPIVREPLPFLQDIHGSNGLAGANLPHSDRKPEKKHAVNFIIDTLMKSDGDITVVTIGPMTNLGMAIRLEPAIVKKMKKHVFMGGALKNGNVTPAAEFNAIVDPEAAHICCSAGVPLNMVGLDATEKAMVYPNTVDRFRKIDNPASKLFCDMMDFYLNVQKEYGFDGGPMHDPLALATLINPDVVVWASAYMQIDVDSSQSYGRTNCDIYMVDGQKPNVKVATDTNNELFLQVLEKCMHNFN